MASRPNEFDACPSREDLVDYVRAIGPASLHERIASHLEGCGVCEESVWRLDLKFDTLGPLLRKGAKSPVLDESQLRRYEQRLAEADWHEDTKPCASADDTRRLPPPEMIGRYKVVRRLGGGGFGHVYLARDPDLDREVAVKIARRPAEWSEEERQSFQSEARKAAKLKHPHVVSVYDVGISEQHGPYIVMEYVAGGTLAQRLAGGALSVEETCRLMSQVADALRAAHKQHLYHRDLKPSNILIGGDGNAKVADFGLAIADSEQLARKGEIAGTAAYMSPEQINGQVHLLDGRTDIWSLGVVIYECLAGHKPFCGETEEDLFDQILRRDPKPLRQLREEISRELDDCVQRCLHKRPPQRPPTARDVRDTLVRAGASPNRLRRKLLLGAALCGIAAPAAAALYALQRQWASSDEAGYETSGEWVDMLTSAPKPIVWEPTGFDSFGITSGSSRHLSIRTNGRAVLQLAEAPAKSFTCRLSFIAENWKTLFGIVWGIPLNIETFTNDVGVTTGVLLVRPRSSESLGVSIESVSLKRFNASTHYVDNPRLLYFGETAYQRDTLQTVTLAFRDGRFSQATSQGRPVSLTKRSTDEVPDAQGGIGVMCGTGYFIVRGAHLRIDE
jgi:serine/threonine protein kinase